MRTCARSGDALCVSLRPITADITLRGDKHVGSTRGGNYGGKSLTPGREGAARDRDGWAARARCKRPGSRRKLSTAALKRRVAQRHANRCDRQTGANTAGKFPTHPVLDVSK